MRNTGLLVEVNILVFWNVLSFKNRNLRYKFYIYLHLFTQEVNSRKHVQMMTQHVAKKDHQVKHETFYSHKFSKRLADQNRREHEDHLKHFAVREPIK